MGACGGSISAGAEAGRQYRSVAEGAIGGKGRATRGAVVHQGSPSPAPAGGRREEANPGAAAEAPEAAPGAPDAALEWEVALERPSLPRLGLRPDGRVVRPALKRSGTGTFKRVRFADEISSQDLFAPSQASIAMTSPAAARDKLKVGRAPGTASVPVEYPDFSGTWYCTQVEGDWSKFLCEQGSGWAARKAAAALGHGVGHEITIKQDPLYLKVVKTTAQMKSSKTTFRLDGVSEQTTNLGGRACISAASWDGKTLVTREKAIASSHPTVTSRHALVGDTFCTECTSPAGTTVRRVYRRRS